MPNYGDKRLLNLPADRVNDILVQDYKFERNNAEFNRRKDIENLFFRGSARSQAKQRLKEQREQQYAALKEQKLAEQQKQQQLKQRSLRRQRIGRWVGSGAPISIISLMLICSLIYLLAGSMTPITKQVVVGDKTYSYQMVEPSEVNYTGGVIYNFVGDVTTSIGKLGDGFSRLIVNDGVYNGSLLNYVAGAINITVDGIINGMEAVDDFFSTDEAILNDMDYKDSNEDGNISTWEKITSWVKKWLFFMGH